MSFADNKHRCCRHQAQGNKSFYFPAFFMTAKQNRSETYETVHIIHGTVSYVSLRNFKVIDLQFDLQFYLQFDLQFLCIFCLWPAAAPCLRLLRSKMVTCLFLLNLRKRQILPFHAGFIYRIHFIPIND